MWYLCVYKQFLNAGLLNSNLKKNLKMVKNSQNAAKLLTSSAFNLKLELCVFE